MQPTTQTCFSACCSACSFRFLGHTCLDRPTALHLPFDQHTHTHSYSTHSIISVAASVAFELASPTLSLSSFSGPPPPSLCHNRQHAKGVALELCRHFLLLASRAHPRSSLHFLVQVLGPCRYSCQSLSSCRSSPRCRNSSVSVTARSLHLSFCFFEPPSARSTPARHAPGASTRKCTTPRVEGGNGLSSLLTSVPLARLISPRRHPMRFSGGHRRLRRSAHPPARHTAGCPDRWLHSFAQADLEHAVVV